ncbi:rRNA maturation RNase YbeY [Aliidiomarina shirensis]|uniref:Endoribonuclease YbeY n=1 Tax=Aliidiomarina shirensis TaxID=1048642 RepID=A0A432WYI3_9GAMM|nr:rRNA maturation RNase YbeY [Aliidiomarina shirensis]RUO38858.1 rRNA maturation RNase YbeY [Aliidiomarina shirensis]
MNYHIDIQRAVNTPELPTDADIIKWASAVLSQHQLVTAEMTIRITDAEEVQTLNREYRGKDKPTNVLSFPFGDELPDEVLLDIPLLGDIVICEPVLQAEANEQNIAFAHHFAHLVVHGTLHLLGYDHIETPEAEEMEALEAEILATFNIPNPYANEQQTPALSNHSRSE